MTSLVLWYIAENFCKENALCIIIVNLYRKGYGGIIYDLHLLKQTIIVFDEEY